jgi:hypothetical protein
VGIVAVDPSSPFSGGAILGDRIRMQSLALDKGVFIRSMATRGNLGGLARRPLKRSRFLMRRVMTRSLSKPSASARTRSRLPRQPMFAWSCWCPEWATTCRR